MITNLPYVEGISEKLRRTLRYHQKNPLSTLSSLCVHPFVNQKIEYLRKIKTISFKKLTVVTAKQSTLVNINGL